MVTPTIKTDVHRLNLNAEPAPKIENKNKMKNSIHIERFCLVSA